MPASQNTALSANNIIGEAERLAVVLGNAQTKEESTPAVQSLTRLASSPALMEAQGSEADINIIISMAKLLESAIKNTRSPDEARALLSTLQQLAGTPAVLGSSSARMVVGNCVASGNLMCDYIETEYVVEQINLQTSRFAISKAKDALAHHLDKADTWLPGEREYYESINPNINHNIVMLGENGELVTDNGELMQVAVNGQELRDSIAIYNAYANKGQLDEDGIAELNKLLYGNEEGPGNWHEKRKGAMRLRQAIRDVEGLAASEAPTRAYTEAASKRAQVTIAAAKRVEEIEEREINALTDPNVILPMPGEKENAQQDFESILRGMGKTRNNLRLSNYGMSPEEAALPASPLPESAPLPSLDIINTSPPVSDAAMDVLNGYRANMRAQMAGRTAPVAPPAVAITAPEPERVELAAGKDTPPGETPPPLSGNIRTELADIRNSLETARSTIAPSAPLDAPILTGISPDGAGNDLGSIMAGMSTARNAVSGVAMPMESPPAPLMPTSPSLASSKPAFAGIGLPGDPNGTPGDLSLIFSVVTSITRMPQPANDSIPRTELPNVELTANTPEKKTNPTDALSEMSLLQSKLTEMGISEETLLTSTETATGPLATAKTNLAEKTGVLRS